MQMRPGQRESGAERDICFTDGEEGGEKTKEELNTSSRKKGQDFSGFSTFLER